MCLGCILNFFGLCSDMGTVMESYTCVIYFVIFFNVTKVDSGIGTWWIQVDSSGFRWILIFPIGRTLRHAQALAHARGGFSATTSPPYNIKTGKEKFEFWEGPVTSLRKAGVEF